MWGNTTQASQPSTGIFNYNQTGTGMSFGTGQPSTGGGIFGNQPATTAGSGLFNAGFSNPNNGAIPMPAPSQPNTGFGGFGGGMMQASNNGMGQAGSTGLFGGLNQQTGMNNGMNTNGQGMTQPNPIFGTPNTNPSTGGMFGGAATNTGATTGIFGGTTNPNNSIFGAKPQTGGTGMFGSTGFGGTSQTSTTGGFFGAGQQQQQQQTNPLFGQSNTATTAPNNGMFGFGQQQQQQQTTPMFGAAKPTSGFLGNNQPSTGFGFTGAATGTTPFGTTNPSTFANNAAKPFSTKKFTPTKPKNDTVAKEKNANAVVACITNFDEFHTFSKEELRVMYLQNPQAFQSQPAFGANPMFPSQNNQTGMFGQQTPATNFGQGTTSTGMFGQQANNTGGMFGQTQQNTGGMFGQQPQQGFTGTTPNQTFGAGGGALFNPNQASGNSLFGNKLLTPNVVATGNNLAATLFTATQPQQQNTGGGLFSTPNQNTGGGLFSPPQQQQQQGTGMFGQPQQQQQSTLFGAPSSNNTQAGGSLFAGAGGTLFGQNPSPQTGGMFSTPNTQQQPTQQPSLFGNQQQQTGSLFSPGSLFTSPQQQQQNQPSNLLSNTSLFQGGNMPLSSQNPNQQNTFPSLLSTSMQPSRKNIFSSTSYYEATGALRPSTATPYYYTSSNDNLFVTTPQVAQVTNLIASDIMNSIKGDRFSSREYHSQQLQDYERARKELRRKFEEEMFSQTDTLGYAYPDYSGVEYNRAQRNSRDNYHNYDAGLYRPPKKSALNYERPEIFTDQDYREERRVYRETPSDKRKQVTPQEKPEPNFKKNKAEEGEGQRTSSEEELANIEELPICKSLNIKPEIVELSRMTRKELRKVEGLTVWNDFGKVEWDGPVNLLNVNLDEWIQISKNSIEIEDKLTNNSSCTLHFFNFGNFMQKSKTATAIRNFKTKLSQWLRTSKLKLVSFSEESGELIAKYDI